MDKVELTLRVLTFPIWMPFMAVAGMRRLAALRNG